MARSTITAPITATRRLSRMAPGTLISSTTPGITALHPLMAVSVVRLAICPGTAAAAGHRAGTHRGIAAAGTTVARAAVTAASSLEARDGFAAMLHLRARLAASQVP
jgi:hypothetical protein